MSIKSRLVILNFLEFFAWGAWLLSAGAYMYVSLKFTGLQIGAVYGTLGIASLFMPAIMGIIADKWLNAERVFGLSHIILGILLFWITTVTDFNTFYFIVFLISMFYMPTIALNNSISYAILEKNNFDIVTVFPPIRVWGTVGFIIAAWIVDVLGWKVGKEQFLVSAIASIVLGIYAFMLPACPPVKSTEKKSLIQRFGLDAFVLFKNRKMAVFFIFSLLLGAALQITNIWGVPFLEDFALDYKGYFAVEHSLFLMTLSQISETLFILTIPFMLKRFGIKKVMLMSMLAWVLRFGFFGIGNPAGGFVFLILSMIIYGMAFDFFNISGSLFVEKESKPSMRSSAQGLFMLMTNGLGAVFGAYASGFIIDLYTLNDGTKNWQTIWFIFAAYALIVTIAFAFLFKYKHNSKDIINIKH
ncbi:nucleoside permease [Yeosuana sp.]|uniref:nucleoside permease n=1 Tax=Yeosuana sp. TaxID=2529388 RepID=UPI004054A76A